MKTPSPLNNPSLQTLFNTVPGALLLVDGAGLIVEANPAALSLLGYTKTEMIGLKVEALMPAGYRAEHAQHREAFNRAPEKRPMGSGNPLFALKHDGTELQVDISLDQLCIDDAPYTLAMMQITDRRHHAEDSLKLSAQRLHLAKQAAHLGVFDFNADRELLDWDERMRDLWGAESAGAMAAHKLTTIIHPLDRAARQAALDHAIDPKGSGEYNIEYRVINPLTDAMLWVSAVGKAHFIDNEPIRLIGVARDITDQKLLEQNLVKHRNEAETVFTQQVASLTASAIAHELNQPLAAISAYSEVALRVLENEVIDQESLKRALGGCVKQAQRAGNSLHELLAFLHKGDLIREPLDLNRSSKRIARHHQE